LSENLNQLLNRTSVYTYHQNKKKKLYPMYEYDCTVNTRTTGVNPIHLLNTRMWYQ